MCLEDYIVYVQTVQTVQLTVSELLYFDLNLNNFRGKG